MNQQQLWEDLKQQGLVAGEAPKTAEATHNLWYARAMQGFAGWLAAVFLIGFLGFGVAGLFEHGAALVIMGLMLNFGSYRFFKASPASDFFEQLVLVFSLTGQFLFVVGLFQLFEFKNQQWFMLVAFYQLALVWLVNHWLHRFLSTWFAILAFFWSFNLLLYSGLGSAILAGLFVWLWLDKTGWQAAKQLYEPIAYAVAVALLQFNLPHDFSLASLFWFRNSEPNWLMLNGHLIAAALNSVVLLYFVYRMFQEQGLDYGSKSGQLVVLAAVLLLFTALPILGVSSALLVLLVGFARRNHFLMALGVLALLGFVSWYYYNLDTTLLNKSLMLMAVGLVLVGGYVFVGKIFQTEESSQDNQELAVQSGGNGWQKTAAVMTLVFCLVGVNHAIMQKEDVLANAQSVYLELAPVDPRSLMQGDYMVLRFAMAEKIRANMPVSSLPGEQKNHDGWVFVSLDERGVGQFHALSSAVDYDSLDQETVVKMQYRIRNNRVQFATNAFFFQEGDAPLFDQARFGEFKVSSDGELLLKAMYDKDLKLLGENRLD